MELYDKNGEPLNEPVVYCPYHTPVTTYRVSEFPEDYNRFIFLRRDLDKARTILDLIRKREKLRRSLVAVNNDLLDYEKDINKNIWIAREAWIDNHSEETYEKKHLRIRRGSQLPVVTTPAPKRGKFKKQEEDEPEDGSKSLPEKDKSSKKRKQIITELEPIPSSMKTRYRLNEEVMALQDGTFYNAKILNVMLRDSAPIYLVHYRGFNKKFDEYVSEDRLSKLKQ
jgi:hypothetical protein